MLAFLLSDIRMVTTRGPGGAAAKGDDRLTMISVMKRKAEMGAQADASPEGEPLKAEPAPGGVKAGMSAVTRMKLMPDSR